MGIFKDMIQRAMDQKPREAPSCDGCGAPWCCECRLATCTCYGSSDENKCYCPLSAYRETDVTDCDGNVDDGSEGTSWRCARVRRSLEIVARVVFDIRELPNVMPLRVHDHKGCLTVWWPHAGGLRFKKTIEDAWGDEGESGDAVEHRLGLPGVLVFGSKGFKSSDEWDVS